MLLSSRCRWLAAASGALVAALLGVNLFLFGCVYLGWQAAFSWQAAFNSDHLLVSGVCDDVLSGRSLSGWHWPGAPYVFPDMLLMLPCRWLLHQLAAEFVAYDALLFLALLAAAAAVGRAAGLGRRQAWAAAAAGLLLLLATYLGPAYCGRVLQICPPGSHLGVLPIGLLLLALAAAALRRGWRPAAAVLFVACGGLGAFSDKLLVVQFLVPLAAALLVLAACRVIGPRSLAWHLGLIAAAVLLALALRWLVPYTGICIQTIEDAFQPPRWEHLGALLGRLRTVLSGQYLLQALIPLQLLAAVAVVRAYTGRGGSAAKEGEQGPHPAAARLVGLVLLLAPLCNLGALAVTGMTDGTERYALPVYVLPFLTLGVLLRLLPGRPALAGFRVVVAAAVVLAAYRAATGLPAVEPSALEPPYSPMARALDRLAEQRGIRYGLAGFWNARHLTLQSHAGVRVLPMTNSGGPLVHAANSLHFLAAGPDELRTPRYQFIVVARGHPRNTPGPELVEWQFGTPNERLAVGEEEIWIYDRLHSSPFDRFLRAQLADRLVRTRPFVGPARPACLAQPKATGTPCDATHLLTLAEGPGVDVRFTEPVRARTLDVGAAPQNQFDLDLYRGERLVGRLHVPPVVWDGSCYGTGGIKSRLLDLPADLQDQAWDHIRVRPRWDSGPIVLAHVLAFEEAIPDTGCGPPDALPSWRLEAEDIEGQVGPNHYEFREPTAEAPASGGKVTRVEAGAKGVVARTPRLPLPAGRYRLTWALRADATPPRKALAVIGLQGFDLGGQMLADHVVWGEDFPAAGRWVTHSVPFELKEEASCLEFTLRSTGRTALAVDYLEVVPLRSASPAD
jgi:hypothetical protein